MPNWVEHFLNWLMRRVAQAPMLAPIEAAPGRVGIKVSARAAATSGGGHGEQKSAFTLPILPKGVVPSGSKLAMDEASYLDMLSNWTGSGTLTSGMAFFGYPFLSELTQRPEYRRASEILAGDMTREWVKITGKGDADKADKLAEIEEAFKHFDVRDVVRRALELDGFFGRGQIYIDTGDNDNVDELRLPLVMHPSKFGKGRLVRLTVVEPTWTSPYRYNSNNPLDPTFFRPQAWFVMGKEIHTTRLLTIISRPLPDMLRPAYNFSGLPLTQMMEPYVSNWLRTRQSVSDLLHSFTVFVLSMNMGGILQGGTSSDEYSRLDLFKKMRDNRGLLIVDKESEDLKNVSVPLGTLDHLQAQSQEQMASVTGIPLVKLLGITPSGLNASTDGEIRAFYDWVASMQEIALMPVLRIILEAVQLHLFGEIDPDIGLEFNPLWQLDATALAAVHQTNAAVDEIYLNTGVLRAEEVRDRIAKEEGGAYTGLDLTEMGDAPGMGDPVGEAVLAALGGGQGDTVGDVVLEALGGGEDDEGSLADVVVESFGGGGSSAKLGRMVVGAMGGNH